LVATFDEPIALTGSGTVTLRNLTLGAGSDEVISLPDARVSVSGAELTIDPSGAYLDASTDYAVRISADAVTDVNLNAFAGISDDTTWNFSSTAATFQAGVEITPDHIQGVPTYAVQDTLLVIDVPSSDVPGTFSGPGDSPDWPGIGDDGFSLPAVANFMVNETSRPGWEPDGTKADAAPISWLLNRPGQSVAYAFDLPDGASIHNVWATWHTQGNAGVGHTHTYDEGTLTTFTHTAQVASAGDMILRWTDSDGGGHNETFQRIFAGPITVAAGDGFVVTFTQGPTNNKFPYIDAVVIDVTPPAAPTVIRIR
jgi:hypothetical protein